ncbi:MAG: T9SS type A sorting domain-containing protein [Flavobacteriales bacterium]|nr:T9SS type A sorting domain-containing protein [Flavobacteriales bacterium]
MTLILSLLFIQGISQNLLLNGGAELGNITNWTANSNSIGVTSSEFQPQGSVFPQEGSYFFTFHETPNNSAILIQEGILVDPLEMLNLSGYFNGEYWSNQEEFDFGEVILSLFDIDNNLIASETTGELEPLVGVPWIEFSLNLPLNNDSYSWKVELKGDRVVGGSINVYYDNLVLTNTSSVSINEIDERNRTILYPNPFSNTLTIQKEFADLKEIRIYSMNANEIVDVIAIHNNEIDLSNISSGNYLAVGYNKNTEIIFKEKIIKK